MQQPEIPLDLDHTCGMGQAGGARSGAEYQVVNGYLKTWYQDVMRNCPACCYIRGWQDKALKGD